MKYRTTIRCGKCGHILPTVNSDGSINYWDDDSVYVCYNCGAILKGVKYYHVPEMKPKFSKRQAAFAGIVMMILLFIPFMLVSAMFNLGGNTQNSVIFWALILDVIAGILISCLIYNSSN